MPYREIVIREYPATELGIYVRKATLDQALAAAAAELDQLFSTMERRAAAAYFLRLRLNLQKAQATQQKAVA